MNILGLNQYKVSYCFDVESCKSWKGLEIDHLEGAMNDVWRQGDGKPSGGTAPENEIVLANFSGQFFVCQKPGHKSYTCPQKKKNSGGQK